MAFSAANGSSGAPIAIVANGAATAGSLAVGSGSFANKPLAGQLLILIVAIDNDQTTDGDEVMVTSVTDNISGVWLKGAEFTNGQTAAKAGTCCSIWYNVAASNWTNSTVTANFKSATARAAAMTMTGFVFGAGSTIAVEGTPGTLANDGADPGSLNVTTANIECLRVRGISSETNSTTDITATSGSWTKFLNTQTGSGGSAANQAVRGEWIISTGTGAASDPTFASADHASVYVAFREVVAVAGVPQRKPFNYQPFLAQ